MNKTDLIKRAIESAKCRLYKVRVRDSYSFDHQRKAENQTEIMGITIEALEKQIPKKVLNIHKSKCSEDIEFNGEDTLYGNCPNCKGFTMNLWCHRNCGDCGQALDWSEEE